MNLNGPVVMKQPLTCHWRCVYCGIGYTNVCYAPLNVPYCLCIGGVGVPMLLIDYPGSHRTAYNCNGYVLNIVPIPELTA